MVSESVQSSSSTSTTTTTTTTATTTTTTSSSSSSSSSSSPSTSSTASSSVPYKCSADGCNGAGTHSCPTCIELALPSTHFCSQDCFKKQWKKHNEVHKLERLRREYRPPPFDYTGPLRPAYMTPIRTVADHIAKPDYYLTGFPKSEQGVRGGTTVKINNKKDIEGIRAACRIGRELLDLAASIIKPGVTTDYIDQIVHETTIARDAYPSPLYYHNFPKACCTSINEVICHGIPDTRPLQDGDIVNVDISVYYKGYHADLNETFCVGNVDADSKRLIKTTYEALMLAVQHVKPGSFFRDFGEIISKHVHKEGFSVVRSYCGHGVGELFHCPPNVPHYSKNKAVGTCKPGMVFTIEPMINAGTWKDVLWPDNWTSVTKDGKRSAQFEHTLLVTETGVEVLTARTPNSPPLFWENENQNQNRLAN